MMLLSTPPSSGLAAYALVMVGGALGAAARFALGQWVAHALAGRAMQLLGTPWPLATLACNIGGGLVMGGLLGILARMPDAAARPCQLLLGVGLLGGFTTFSAFSAEAVMMLKGGYVTGFLLYALLSVAGSVAALALGLWLAQSAVRIAG